MRNISDSKTIEFINLSARLQDPVVFSKIFNNINIFDVSTISYNLGKPIMKKNLFNRWKLKLTQKLNSRIRRLSRKSDIKESI